MALAQRRILDWSAFVFLFLLGMAGIVGLQRSRLHPQQSQLTAREYQRQSQQEKLQLDIVKNFPAFGLDNLLADWLYLRFIQYFGDTPARETVGYSLSPDYFRGVINRDPRFVDAILKLSSATSIFAGEPQKSVQYLGQSAVQISPQQTVFTYPPYYLWIYKGIDELLFLGNVEASKQSYGMAVNWAKDFPDPVSQETVQRLSQTIRFLAKKPDSKIAQIGAWSMVLSSTSDPRTQQRAIAEIRGLGGVVVQTGEGRLAISVPKDIE